MIIPSLLKDRKVTQMNQETSDSTQARLRQLSVQAYESELALELSLLAVRFDEWRAEQITTIELNRLVQEYVNGPARTMLKYYSNVDPALAVGRAVAEDLLEEEEIEPELLPLIQDAIQRHQEFVGDGEEANDGA
jgi:hypothetical protein